MQFARALHSQYYNCWISQRINAFNVLCTEENIRISRYLMFLCADANEKLKVCTRSVKFPESRDASLDARHTDFSLK